MAGTWRGSQIAAKVTKTSDVEAFLAEADLMTNLRPHNNLVQVFGVAEKDGQFFLVMEYLSGGSLIDLLRKQKKRGHPLDLLQKVSILKGIASGMMHLHSERIVHRDLAARNVLVRHKSPNGADRSPLTLIPQLSKQDKTYIPKISDFGLSKEDMDFFEPKTIVDATGPIRWMASEAIGKHQYSPASDVFSYGITLWEILTDGELPLKDIPLRDIALRRRCAR
jgi:serine/threonine protein kinase